ncbi:hypothetical protein LZ554_009264 [Drepanopeziza brunnea f. sp. 'monogermtubi']|nr:hypothetical protein LZ554_009264 [Drepanopeziza brunnea f. sp. 'monogermtubi']
MRYSTAVIVALAASLTNASVIDRRAAYCQTKADTCRAEPDANETICAIVFIACVGPSSPPQETTSTSAAAPSITAPVVDCYSQANECRTVPGANQAVCSAQYASCVGYDPYDGQDEDSYYGDHNTSTSSEHTTPTSSAAPSITAPCSARLTCLGFNPEISLPSTSTM